MICKTSSSIIEEKININMLQDCIKKMNYFSVEHNIIRLPY